MGINVTDGMLQECKGFSGNVFTPPKLMRRRPLRKFLQRLVSGGGTPNPCGVIERKRSLVLLVPIPYVMVFIKDIFLQTDDAK
jgi:hypothetical protein